MQVEEEEERGQLLIPGSSDIEEEEDSAEMSKENIRWEKSAEGADFWKTADQNIIEIND